VFERDFEFCKDGTKGETKVSELVQGDSRRFCLDRHTGEHGSCLHHNALDMHWRLLELGSDVAACCEDEVGICFAVSVLEVEPTKVDDSGRYGSLAEHKTLA